jgi:hypothetical protein
MNVKTLFKYTGIDPATGVPQVEDRNGDGSLTNSPIGGDYYFMFDTDPDYFGGLQNTFRYKNFQLDVYLYYEKRPHQEGFLYNYYSPLGTLGQNIPKEFASGYWMPGSTDAKYPGLATSTSSTIGYEYAFRYTLSDAMYSDASYISLKNVALSYHLPSSLATKVGAKNVRVYVKGENLATFSKYDAWNPETKSAIAPFRTITAGFNVTF